MVTGHNFKSILPKDHPCHVCFKLADWFQRKRILNNFPIGSYVKTMSADVGHLGWRSGSQDIILKVALNTIKQTNKLFKNKHVLLNSHLILKLLLMFIHTVQRGMSGYILGVD